MTFTPNHPFVANKPTTAHQTVTAILVNYFGHAHIAQAVASLQADAPDLDVVVVDNSDHPEEAAALQAALSFAPSATVLTAARNLGFGQACNWAAAMRPEATFYWLVNPDVRILPGCLNALLNSLHQHPDVGAVAPIQFLDAERCHLLSPSWRPTALGVWATEVAQRQPRAWQRYTTAVRAESLRVWQAVREVSAGLTPQILRQRALSGGVLLLRRHAVAQIGGLFDPRYFMYYEDSDLCLRLRRGGWGMALVPQAHALHLWTMGTHKAELMAQTAALYFDTHFPGSAWLVKAAHLTQTSDVSTCIHHHHRDWPWEETRPIPAAWQSGWLLELSPNPLLLPSALFSGTGTVLHWPSAMVAAGQGCPLFARLTPLSEAHHPHTLHSSRGATPSLWWRLAVSGPK